MGIVDALIDGNKKELNKIFSDSVKKVVEENYLHLSEDEKGNNIKKSLGKVDPEKEQHITNLVKSDIMKEILIEWADQNNYKTDMGEKVNDLLMKHYNADMDINEFKNILLNNPYKMKFDGKIHSLSDIKDIYSDFINPKGFQIIFEFNPPVGGVSVGKGEMFLSLFTNLSNSLHAGDLMINNEGVEIKGVGAALQGQSPKKRSMRAITDDMKKALNTDQIKEEDVKGTLKDNANLLTILQKQLEGKDTRAQETMIIQMVNAWKSFEMRDITVPKNVINEILHASTAPNNKGSQEYIRTIIGTMNALSYISSEDFKYIVFMNKTHFKGLSINAFKDFNLAFKEISQLKLSNSLSDTYALSLRVTLP